MTTTANSSRTRCPACQGKDEPDTDTAGSSTTKGGSRASSQPWHTRARRCLATVADQVLEAILTSGTYRIT